MLRELLLFLLVLLLIQTSQTLYFEDGYDHHYTYSSESDVLGMHNVTTIIKFRVRPVNETGGGNTLCMLMVDSFVQHSERGYVADNAMKWKLDHKFYFTVGDDGVVTFVHFDPEENDELLSLKKVLASTLSTKVKIGSSGNYISEEVDHTGFLEHEYSTHRKTDGFKVTRGHKSFKNVHRSHNKTVDFDWQGTPVQVVSTDNVTLAGTTNTRTRTIIEGETEIPETQNGEFPDIASISRTKIMMTAKSKHFDGGHHIMSELKQDTLEIREKSKSKIPLSSVEVEISNYLICIHAIENKYDRNRTECVIELRRLVTSLHLDDFIHLGEKALSKSCPDNDTLCIDERNLFIDIISEEGSPDAQLMMLNTVLSQRDVSENDIRRCLFHCIAIKSPIIELVEHVEGLCFQDGVKDGETPAMSMNQKRACLSLGAMAKSLHDKNASISDRIVERMENWLQHHNESKSLRIVKPRRRRSVIQNDPLARKHVETKMVLLQSLGNAGKQRSLRHIRSYMEPNVGVTAWRRAAIHSLRHFECNESAHSLLVSAVNDDDEVVRKSAVTVLQKHPKSKNFTVEHENIVLSRNYSYPVVVRVRRGLMDALEKGIQVQIKTPGIEWDKVLGSRKIGASFGLHIRNILDLKLGILDGHFMIDVYDGAYAEAHVGVVNFQVDILKALICFKGHIKYDLNVLKDFGINGISDLVHIYDKIIAKIVDPIKDAVNRFKEIITVFRKRSLTNIINTLVTTVKDLPHLLGEVATELDYFVKEIFSIAGSTVMEEIKVIVQHIRQFIDGVKQDVLKFYNDIVDAVTMALPYIGKKIVEGFNLIVEGLKALFTNPMQGITAMSRAITDVKMAVTMIMDTKTKIVNACLFMRGRAAEWFNTMKEIPSILKRLAEAFKKITKSVRKRRDIVGDMTSVFSNGVEQSRESLQLFEEKLKAQWDRVWAPLRPLMDIAKPFLKEFKTIMDVSKELKKAYKNVKKVIETSKKLVQKVFGPKFHRDFPTERRPARGSCKEGVWPSTANKHYATTGVDLSLGKGQTIKMPVNGILHIKHNKRVLVQPTDPEFSSVEIVIDNINVRPEIGDGINYAAGTKIGRADTAPACKPNFVHLAVRMPKEKEADDADYEYTDPSPFLDRLVPIPKWIQECNDHEFRYIGQTFESGESADGEPDEESEEIERNPEDFGGMDDMIGAESPEYRPDDPSLYDQTPFGDSLKKSLKEEAKKFANFFKTALFGKEPKVPNILSIVDINGKNITWVLNHLKASSLGIELKSVIAGLSNKMTAPPKGNPLTLAVPYIKNILKMNGISGKIGDLTKMSDTLMHVAEKACPMFNGAIAAGFGHVCTVQADCLGISCSVSLPKGPMIEHVQIGVTVKPEKDRVEVTVNGKRLRDIIADGFDTEFDMDVSFFGMKLYMAANLKFKNGLLSLSAEAKLCIKIFSTCLPHVELFHDIKFKPLAVRHRRGISTEDIQTGLMALPVPRFIEHLADYQMLNKNITKILEDVRSTVVNELLEDTVDKIEKTVKEFTDKVDFCVSANIPVPPFDKTFFNLRFLFMVGPVPLSLGFGGGGSIGMGVKVGICVLSMTTQLTLTPWVGIKVWGDAAVDIGFARGGIRLIGMLMETKFPILTELVFSKYPIDVGSKMDLVLTPLRLILKAFAELNLLFTKVTVFDANIWEYAVPSITKNIFHKKKREDDQSPPNTLPATINQRRKREGIRGCIVTQVPQRPYYSPAFMLEMHAEDEVSDVKLFYAIGSHRGGTNVVDWTEMGGAKLLAPTSLPGGIPLYWTVKARNSQGLEAIQQCSLNTYDSTLPDGRVEHSYKFSSHPNKLHASLKVFEDSPLADTHFKAVGFSPGQFGSQFVDWATLRLDHSVAREGVSGNLRHFTVPREGKLVAWILQSTTQVRTPELCAKRCIVYGQNCVSFDYEYHSETCDLHDIVQGANAYLRKSGTYSNYERLGSGYHTPLEYSNLTLQTGMTYFVNAKVTNVLGYEAFLIGEGTMVDFTPPEPGLIKNSVKDVLKADRCNAALTQQCIDVTWENNHRLIIDGDGSSTVFNGHEPLFDELYTLTNHYVTANWNGFHDDECGIWGYTWAVGRQVCGSDVIKFEDPFSHLSSKKFWTDSAFHKNVHLEDGKYYVTVQALNGAELGGSLVTTVCHSNPFVVDTSPPVFNKVTDIIYDEDFDLIAIYYNATDDMSKIAKAEFGLGKTKYDVKLRPYSLHASMDRNDPFVAVEDLGLEEGKPAWLRIRVTNKVDLFTSGHGDEPIMIDKSSPIAGEVLDGDLLRLDRNYQSEHERICAQWINFHDPQSGLSRFLWGVGTAPKLDNIVGFHNLTHYDKSGCAPASLLHNHTYYSTVYSYNNALNSKSANSTSDGVLIDLTSPVPGKVFDGKLDKEELQFTSESVSKYVNWRGYYDPESHIASYKVNVLVNGEQRKSFSVGAKTEFEDHTIPMEHLDRVHYTVYGVNGAGLEESADTDGFLVDHTSPIMSYISDNEHNSGFQSNDNVLKLSWDFYDSESYIHEYRTIIYKTQYGVKQKFWPTLKPYNSSTPKSKTNGRIAVNLNDLGMEDGVRYSLHVTALNGALLATSHETPGVTIDTTPPSAPKIRLGLPKEEEELDKEGRVLHDDEHAIRLSWTGIDSESGIEHFLVAVGTDAHPELIYSFTSYGKQKTAYIQHINLQTFTESGITYVASIKAINGAGLESVIGKSKQIYVQKADVPGIVFDGRDLFNDKIYTFDRTSIAASFFGFESESCNIINYEWAIGTTEYGTDVLTYTDYGVVMINYTHGQAQIHIELYEDTTYYVTVRAVTSCRDAYILSSSDGITLDTTPPKVTYNKNGNNDTTIVVIHDVLFQDAIDTLALSTNVSDSHSIENKSYALGSLPFYDDKHQFTSNFHSLAKVTSLSPGEAIFITTDTTDKAGNKDVSSSMALISDNTAPQIKKLECTNYLSYRKSILTCKWDTVAEYESRIDYVKLSLRTERGQELLVNRSIPFETQTFSKDLYKQIYTMKNITKVLSTIMISNVVGQSKIYGKEIIVDLSKPEFDGLDVVTTLTLKPSEMHQKCQPPKAFVELRARGLVDTDSGIDNNRYKVSLGYRPFGTDILNYVDVKQKHDDTFFVDGFNLNIGTVFYCTLRAYNKAGLYVDISSDSVVVSQAPYLHVIDGPGKEDIDYQSLPNLLQGHWQYSDLCPIREAYWSVSDLAGNVLFDFQHIPSASKDFYNDEVSLENGRKYITTVKTIDFLNRTKVARSNGVTVRIQPPYPGHVRDGLYEDQNYQYSTTELSANWDDFGDSSNDPTQFIQHYEVAIGNDRRYEKTRSNVHFFVNVGLNTSHTFSYLNLTKKIVRYYITVRSYSLAGGYAEAYSNGIRVGYKDDIVPGSIAVNSYQSKTDEIAISWTGFQSDINILQYKVGISNHLDILSNDTVKCLIFYENSTGYDIYPLHSVGLNEYSKIGNLTLKHGLKYYVTVIAEDEAGMCTSVTSSPILVDTTPPTKGDMYVNNVISTVISFATSKSKMHILWKGFSDFESDVEESKVTLFECTTCNPNPHVSDCKVIAENIVHTDTKTSFYDLNLYAENSYLVLLNVRNGAHQTTNLTSATILIDSSPPIPGVVKISRSWQTIDTFQYSTSKIHGLLSIANSLEDYICPNQIHTFPINPSRRWDLLSKQFSRDFETMNKTGAYLGIGYSSDLTSITKSGILSETQRLKIGNYSFVIKTATGQNIVTTTAFLSDTGVIPWSLSGKPHISEFDYNEFDNVTGLVSSNKNESDNTTTETTLTTKLPGEFVKINHTDYNKTNELTDEQYGFGIHLLGYKIGKNKEWWHILWARNKVSNFRRWFKTSFDPSNANHEYKILVEKTGASLNTDIALTLFIDDDEILSISGYKYDADMHLAFFTWNENGYKPPIDSVYHPFYSYAAVTSISIPDDPNKACLHGKGFYDGQSGISEIHIGVSNSKSDIGNIKPLELFKSICFPCTKPCKDICKQSCNGTRLTNDFTLLSVEISGLTLEPFELNDTCMNKSSRGECNSTVYYINAKFVNFAGLETFAYSNGIQIDTTPPQCEYVRCLDPDYSEEAPTSHIGSNTTIGAYWACNEDISEIEKYMVEVIKVDENFSVISTTSIGLQTKIRFDLDNTTFNDDTDYMVRLIVVNTAGMSTTSSCTVHVDLFPPDVSSASSKPLYSEQGVGSLLDDEPYWSASQTSIGVKWQIESNRTEFIEWAIGTENDKADVFPHVKVGKNAPGSAAIAGGKLKLDGAMTNTSIMDHRDRTNLTEHELLKFEAASERQKAFFYMEPGRCYHQSLYAVGYSHLKSKVKSRTVCIKRKEDVQVHRNSNSVSYLSKQKSSRIWEKKKASSSEVVIEAHLMSGGISVGSLNETDKTSDYGSAATMDYIPYISDPSVTMNKTSRLLRNRIQHVCGLAFFISPTPFVEFKKIHFNVTIPAVCSKDADYQPALIYWDKDDQIWRHIDEGCNDYLTSFIYNTTGTVTYKAEVCNRSLKSRKRRSMDETERIFGNPRDYELIRMRRTFSNSPPKILSDILTTQEDNFTKMRVHTQDLENDELLYLITQQPANANCSIGNTTGLLDCTFEEDFYGLNYIKIQVTETKLPPLEQGSVVEKKLSMVIEDTPDITERFYIDPHGKLHRETKPSMIHSLQVEANGTSNFFAGTLILADVDGGELFTHQSNFSSLGNSTFKIERVDIDEVRKVMFTRYRSIIAYNIYFDFSPDLNGKMTLNIIAKTALNAYTPSLTLHLYVLNNPCVYGDCMHLINGISGCENLERALSFDDYTCTCFAGYKGTWCEIEIDECESDPCSNMFDCEDLVNDYQCDINPGKLSAVLIVPFIVVICLLFLVRKLYQKTNEYRLRQSRVSLVHNVSEPQIVSLLPENPDIVARRRFYQNEAYRGEDIDLSDVSTLTTSAAKRLPPHHRNFATVRTTLFIPNIHGKQEPSTGSDDIGEDIDGNESDPPKDRCKSASSQRSALDTGHVFIDGEMTNIDV